MAAPAAPVSVLPRYMAIRGDNGMYLAIKPDGFLSFDAAQITHLSTHEVLYNVDDPNATFIIRSHNNRFWRRDAFNWIRADRDPPPPATESAARFKLAKLGSAGKLRFQSAADDLYLNRLNREGVHGYNALEKVPNRWSEVWVSDAGEYAISLPQYIFIRGANSMYLHTAHISNRNWLKFHGSDPGNLFGTSEVIPLMDGSLAFYSPQTQQCWRNSTNWIWTDSSRSDAVTNTRCHFEPIKLSRTMLALRNKFNNRICKRLTDYWESSLNAAAETTADHEAHLTVSEAAKERRIFDVKYLLNLASTTDPMPQAVAHGSVVNDSSLVTDMKVRVPSLVATSYTFSNSFTFSQSVSTKFTAGIPFLGAAGIEIGCEKTFFNQWEETTSKAIKIPDEFLVKDVPPGGRASVTIICSTVKMRIPFTYKCTETAPDGVNRPTQEFVDGIFEGVNVYNIEAVVNDSRKVYVIPIDPVYSDPAWSCELLSTCSSLSSNIIK